jgi:hypothetical protein
VTPGDIRAVYLGKRPAQQSLNNARSAAHETAVKLVADYWRTNARPASM